MLIGDKIDKDYHYFYREIKRTSPIKHESIKHEPIKHESIKHEPIKHEPIKHEPIKHESIKHGNREKHRNEFNISNIYTINDRISNESNILHKKPIKKYK